MKKEKKWKTTKTEQKKYAIFFFYPLSFACFSLFSFFIFFFVLPTIYKREQDGEKLRKKFFIFFPVVAPWPWWCGWRLEAGSSCWRRTGGEIKRDPEKREKKPRKVFRPKYTYRPKHIEIHRNGRNTPKHPEILSEVEWEGVSYRFAYRYEIFRPFRPERNGIYNYALNTLVDNFFGWHLVHPNNTIG